MSTRTIKDPTFTVYAQGGNVDKRLQGKGDLKEKDKLIKLAKDEADIVFDIDEEVTRQLKEKYLKNKKPGQSFIDYIKEAPIDELVKLRLSDGGKVISLSSYLKQKEKPKIKKLDLDSVAPGKALANLTEAEKEVVRNLLKLTFGSKD
tara:strand:+ start:317 stop:760 length:444 start_codon:yes stop_codon:yes gene_type:complete